MIFKNFTIAHIFQILICAVLLFSQMVYSVEMKRNDGESIKATLIEDGLQVIQSSVLRERRQRVQEETEYFDSIKYTNPMVIPTDGDMMKVSSSGRMSL